MSLTEILPPYACGEVDQEEDFVSTATDESLPVVGAAAEIAERHVD